MATRRPETDAAIAGLGAAGGVAALPFDDVVIAGLGMAGGVAALPFDKAAASTAHGETRHGD